jgi:ABC-type branched-subunit amino acid transport system substrate-binding protein
MKLNLDVLKTEIRENLESRKFAIYNGYSRAMDAVPMVFWDTHRFPDYQAFLDTAEAAGAKLVVLHTREFSALLVDNAVEQLEDADFLTEDRRGLERRLRELRAYDGFTCAIELSFDQNGRVYMFELRTEWYDEFSDLLDEIESAVPDPEDETDEGPMGGYFSKN